MKNGEDTRQIMKLSLSKLKDKNVKNVLDSLGERNIDIKNRVHDLMNRINPIKVKQNLNRHINDNNAFYMYGATRGIGNEQSRLNETI